MMLTNFLLVDNIQQFFAFKPQASFPANNLNFDECEGDGIDSRQPFKIFSTLQCNLELVTLLVSAKNVTKSHNVTKSNDFM